MSEAPRRPLAGGALVLAAAVLLGAAGGFAAYRLSHRPSLQEAPLAASSPAPPVTAAPATRASQSPATPAASETGTGARPIPERLPDLVLPDVAGTRRRLRDWAGHPLVVNFWATWCEPCRREIPLLKALRLERKTDGIEIVGIAVDFKDNVQEYTRQSGIDYPILVGDQDGYAAVEAFGMQAVLPFTAFADAAGRLVTLKVGELHRDEADLILDRVRDLDGGRINLATARQQVASGMQRLALQRGRGDAAAQ